MSFISNHPTSQKFDLLIDPPDFVSKFPIRDHKDRETIISSVHEYFKKHWEWPSEEHKLRFLDEQSAEWSTLTTPVSPQERAEVYAQYITFWFLYDDLSDVMTPNEVARYIPRIIAILSGRELSGEMTAPERILHDICSRINQIASGRRVFDAAIGYIKSAAAKVDRLESLTAGFEEFFKYRVQDVGGRLALEAILWTREITIPAHLQTEKIQLLQEIAISQACLINDLYSYRKEVKASSQEVREHDETVYNSVTVLMECYQFTLPEVIEDLKKRISDYEDRFMVVSDAVKNTHKSLADDSEIVERFIETLKDLMAGNAAWSAYCGRYNLL